MPHLAQQLVERSETQHYLLFSGRIPMKKELFDELLKSVKQGGEIIKRTEELVRPHVVRPNLELAYSQMSKDKKRESEALEWAEATFKDTAHEKR